MRAMMAGHPTVARAPALALPQARLHPAAQRRTRFKISGAAEESPNTAPDASAAGASSSSFATLRELMKKSREAGPEPDLILSRAPTPPLLFKIVPVVDRPTPTRNFDATAPAAPSPPQPRAAGFVRSRGAPWQGPPVSVTQEVIIGQRDGISAAQQQISDLTQVTSLVTGRALAALQAEHRGDIQLDEILKIMDRTATLTYAEYTKLFDVRNLIPFFFAESFPPNLLQLTEPPQVVRVERECSGEEVHGEVLRHLFQGMGLPDEALQQIDGQLKTYMEAVGKMLGFSSSHLDSHLMLITKYLQQEGSGTVAMLRISWFTLTSDTWMLVVGGGKNKPQYQVQRVKFTVEYLNTVTKLNQELFDVRRPQIMQEVHALTDTALDVPLTF